MAANYTVTAASVVPSAYAKRFQLGTYTVPEGASIGVPDLPKAGVAITAGQPVQQGSDGLIYPADATVVAAQTSGTLVVGRRYTITTFIAGDSFTNVGAASNATGVTFIATGTTPTTWSNLSVLDDADAVYKVIGIAGNSAGAGQAVDVITEDPMFTPGCTLAIGDIVIVSEDIGRICESAAKASTWYVSPLGVAFSTTQMALKIVRSDAPKA